MKLFAGKRQDATAAAHQLCKHFSRQRAASLGIGSHECRPLAGRRIALKSDQSSAPLLVPVDEIVQRRSMRGRDGDSIHMPAQQPLENLSLPRGVVLVRGQVFDAHPKCREVKGGFPDTLPDFVIEVLGLNRRDDGYCELVRHAAHQ